jgi:autotransporter-associated beta strand protein
VSASSTHIGTNTISFISSDPNASNSPQSIVATLNVLDHAAGSASVTAGNGFVAHAGAMGLMATIALANSSGTRSDLEVRSAALSSGTLAGPAQTYWISAGSSQTYTATFSAGAAAGAFSDTATFTAGDRQSLSGAGAIGSLTATISGSVFSGSAAWTSTSGSLWSGGGNWTDTSAVSVHAAPGTFAGFTNTDMAVFNGSGTVTTISLSGANPGLAALSFSGPNYTLTNGTLTLNSASGTATLTVSAGTQTIRSAITGASMILVQGAGQLVVSGSNTFSGDAVVSGGKLIVANPYSLTSGANFTVGNPGAFAGPTVNGHWIAAGGGSWSSANNWDSNGVPGNSIQDTATFGTVIGSKSATVTLDGSRMLDSLTFTTTGGGRYTLSRAASDSTSALTMSGAAGTATIIDSGGSQTVAAPVVLGGKLNVAVAGIATLAISGPILQSGSSRSLSLSGGGTLVLSGTNTFNGGAVVTGGKLIVTAPYSLIDGTSLTVGNAGAFPAAIVALADSRATPVPEPRTLALVAASLVALLCRRRAATPQRNGPLALPRGRVRFVCR